jgi:hypothetical protein
VLRKFLLYALVAVAAVILGLAVMVLVEAEAVESLWDLPPQQLLAQ